MLLFGVKLTLASCMLCVYGVHTLNLGAFSKLFAMVKFVQAQF